MAAALAVFEELRWLVSENEEDIGFEGPLVSIDPIINRKMYLYQGDAYKIPFDAIIVGENEQCSDRRESAGIFALAGPETENDILKVTPIQTGSSALCYGGSLCQHVILSVGPKYEEKYLTASEHALYTAYRTALTIASQQSDIKTLAISPIYLRSSRYPREQAAHIALRVIRRFMEHSISEQLERVVLCVAEDDFVLYQLYMTAYFPRTRQECLNQTEIIPGDMGNEWGDTAVAERSVKITVGPKPVAEVHVPIPLPVDPTTGEVQAKDRRVSLSGSNDLVPTWPRPRSMLAAVEDADTVRLQKINHELSKMTKEQRLLSRFDILAAESADEDLEDIRNMLLLEIAGKDRAGRSVVLIYGVNVGAAARTHPLTEHLIERVQAYVIKVLDTLSCVPFVVVFCCSGVEVETYPEPKWVSTIFDVINTRYVSNLQGTYVLHASYLLRMYIYNSGFTEYVPIESLRELNKHMDVASLRVLVYVKQVDKELFPADAW